MLYSMRIHLAVTSPGYELGPALLPKNTVKWNWLVKGKDFSFSV